MAREPQPDQGDPKEGLVETIDNVRQNLIYLDGIGPENKVFKRYQDLISHGRCFLPYQTENVMAFAPSQFIGYYPNTIEKHRGARVKNGTITNQRSSRILSHQPTDNPELQIAYQNFRTFIGLDRDTTSRKFWRPIEIDFDYDETKSTLDNPPTITERLRIAKARCVQGLFRDILLRKWEGRCSFSSCNIKEILRASHIKPWCESSDAERIDVHNGLLLSPNLDALFDRRLVSFDDNGNLLLSEGLKKEDLRNLGIDPEGQIYSIEPDHLPYLRYHRGTLIWRPATE